ncbi:MAG: prenyltransferase [Candidatus Brachytrichaceae bacterium NZ_4S206]|jgi:1,4-dihydroxy-2-naphthoate octaprenyltransferase
MNTSVWGRALRGVPKLSRDEWNALDAVAKWLIATRSAVLIMTFISAAIAGIFAVRAGKFDFLLWALVTVGLMMAHATNNLLNDMTDYAKGVDKGNYYRAQYGVQPLEAGFWTMKDAWRYAIVTGGVAALCGLACVLLRGGLTFPLMLAGAFFVLAYTWPLKYIGLGEIAVLLVWGPLMIGGGYYVVTGDWDWNVVLGGLPYALGTTMVIFGKHIDKRASDKEKRIFTLPVILGDRLSRAVAIGCMVMQYVLVIGLVIAGFFTPIMLVVLLALRAFALTFRMFQLPKPAEKPDWFPADAWPTWLAAFAFYHNRTFGLLFLLGLVVETALRAVGVMS